jgi:hypothetical protein
MSQKTVFVPEIITYMPKYVYVMIILILIIVCLSVVIDNMRKYRCPDCICSDKYKDKDKSGINSTG